MSAKCACERAKEEMDDLILNPISKEEGSGRLRDAMEAEDNYLRVRQSCSCRSKPDANDSLITHVDSDEEDEAVKVERNVEEEEEEEPARGEKRARSDDEDEVETDNPLRISLVSYELWIQPFDSSFQVPLGDPIGREVLDFVTLDDRKLYVSF